ncbi:MAG TPA: amidohydrolase family protein [Mycobacteriales bacterium]|nr:amidohydrolase family protein [Mycobacteriales bacterium]
MTGSQATKIWAHSGDSHFLEPDDLWTANLTPEYAALVPRSVADPDGQYETVYVDGQSFRRRLPSPSALEFAAASSRPAGARDATRRLADLDGEGIWAEVVFPSLGMWNSSFRTPEVLREALRVSNDWAVEQIMNVSPRLLPTAQVSTLSIEDAIDEMQRCAGLGFRCVCLPTRPHPKQEDYNRDVWEPFWSAAEEARMVLAFHIGTDPLDLAAGDKIGVVYRGPGGAVLNHTESGLSGQRIAMKMVASGALDRHPGLKVLISEGGATWVPFLGDRMLEAYRQHHMAVQPKLSRSPKEILFEQVYASFQHDQSAVAAMTAMGYRNVLWGSDYPHLEGTFGHTQQTLHELFDDQPAAVRERITVGTFTELFPGVGAPPVAPVLAAN